MPKLSAPTPIPPPTMKAKQLEELCLLDAAWAKGERLYCMGRYGVQVSMRWENGQGIYIPLRSLPDFEGVVRELDGRQFIFDAKVCGSASFSIHDDKFKKRQLKHMLERSQFGAICFLLLHFTERRLKTRVEEAITYAFPIHPDLEFWQSADRGEVKSISRINCAEYGVEVRWHTPKQTRKPRPNLYKAVYGLIDQYQGLY